MPSRRAARNDRVARVREGVRAIARKGRPAGLYALAKQQGGGGGNGHEKSVRGGVSRKCAHAAHIRMTCAHNPTHEPLLVPNHSTQNQVVRIVA